MRACGKGSYGRLGLGDSNNQSTLKKLTFEPHRAIKKVSSSKGSDGHTLAFTSEGEVFSWGDGDYGKLGHGNSSTQKYPKLIQGPLQGKVWFPLTRSNGSCSRSEGTLCGCAGGGVRVGGLQTQRRRQRGRRAVHLGGGGLWTPR